MTKGNAAVRFLLVPVTMLVAAFSAAGAQVVQQAAAKDSVAGIMAFVNDNRTMTEILAAVDIDCPTFGWDALDAALHFLRRAAREGEHEDAAWVTTFSNDVGDATSKRGGLAAAGAGDN